MSKSVVCLVGARPNFVKIAPLMRAMESRGELEPLLIHTGQHYDETLSQAFFTDLRIAQPLINLNVGSGSHGAQTADIMKRLESYLLSHRPDAIILVGDVNSTLAGALVASKLQIPMAHVESGLRSFDRKMPEEINRITTDVLSDLLFVTEPVGVENLLQEGISGKRIHLVGDLMIDSLIQILPEARARLKASLRGLPQRFALFTCHRPSNVDSQPRLRALTKVLKELALQIPVVFPIHPRSRLRLEQYGLWQDLQQTPNLHIMPAKGYIAFVGLLCTAQMVITDSGGIQAEAAYLGVPCLTLRDSTERPQTVSTGANQLLGRDPAAILPAAAALMAAPWHGPKAPALMDGNAAVRTATILEDFLSRTKNHP